jgi:3-methyladenine DNA glycosylase/8-oxoguanine DNA glycosylase
MCLSLSAAAHLPEGADHRTAGLDLAGRLVRRFGVRVPDIEHLGVCYVFPSVEVLSDTPLLALMDCGLPRDVACRLLALARAVRARDVDLNGRQHPRQLAGDLARVAGLPRAIADHVASAVVMA